MKEKSFFEYFVCTITLFSLVFNLDAQELCHPEKGVTTKFNDKEIILMDKLMSFSTSSTRERDPDIASPKSVNIHPKGDRFYINSLEGGKTVVYSLPALEKQAVITHKFSDADSSLWSKPSGFFKFRHYSDNINAFMGKPVESTFSHNGKYLWVPYYRRSFDLNAQDPSAVAVIDTDSNKIIRMMEAGVLPKMISCSPDGKTIAIAHWGDNTVGLIDISSDKPSDWHYVANVAVGHQLFHDFSLTTPVNRDSNSGEALRGTVFTPDGRYLLVGCMSGGGIAVIDVEKRQYLGKITGMMPNIRHLVLKDNKLYLSINVAGYVQRISFDKLLSTIKEMSDTPGNRTLTGWESVKVGSGARTLELSPRSDYIFVACNFDSKVCIVDSAMNLVGEIAADSFPVGLDISPDGKWLITTSQGRKEKNGGNCVDIYSLKGIEGAVVEVEEPIVDTADASGSDIGEDAYINQNDKPVTGKIILCSCVVVLLVGSLLLIIRNRRKKNANKG